MSYADWPIPYFSNPNVSVHVFGSMFGWRANLDLGVRQTGLAVTEPKAAYAAKVLNDQALTMSNFSEEIVAPAITQQPRGVSVTRGKFINLSVVATGGGLSYQWAKEGVPISGATAPSYFKTAEDSDAGGYSVTVSNFSGKVISDSATLTITAPVAPPQVPPSASGGGAPSVWLLGLLCLCSLARWMSSRRG